jgi:hypothetical protein
MENAKEIALFLDGLEPGSLTHAMVTILFLLAVFVVVLGVGVWLHRALPEGETNGSQE